MISLFIVVIIFAQQESIATTLTKGDNNEPENAGNMKMTRRDIESVLCIATKLFNAEDMVFNDDFKNRRHLQSANKTTLHKLKHLLHLRLLDVRNCCALDSQDKVTSCLGDVHRRRIDRLCSGDEEQDLPFWASRRTFMNSRMNHCCYRLGMTRYRCYGENSTPDWLMMNESFSLDETNPLNDLWDLPVNNTWIEKTSTSLGESVGKPMNLRAPTLRTENSRFQKRRHLKSNNIKAVNIKSGDSSSIHDPHTTSTPGLPSEKPSTVSPKRERKKRPKAAAVFRHPGALVNSSRKKSKETYTKTTAGSVPTTTMDMTTKEEILKSKFVMSTISTVLAPPLNLTSLRRISSLKKSDLESISQKWWKRVPHNVRKHRKQKGTTRGSHNRLYVVEKHRVVHRLEADPSPASITRRQQKASTARQKLSERQDGKDEEKQKMERINQRRLKKARECVYSVLGVSEDRTLLDILKTIL